MTSRRMAIVRGLIGFLVVLNLQCAVLFLILPARFAPGFELVGIPGEAAIQGTGILFLMWNIPYLFAFRDPLKHRVSFIEAVLMQAIGLIGEGMLLTGLPGEHIVLRNSISRFILFDAAGLLSLCAAFFLVNRKFQSELVDASP